MGTMLKQLWTDPVFFRYCIKGFLAWVGGLLASGLIPTEGWRYGFLVMAIAQSIPAARPPAPGAPPP